MSDAALTTNNRGGLGGEDDGATPRRKFPKHLVEIYDIECLLGSGAFSTVWQCRHRSTSQVRAVKKIDTSEVGPRDIAHEIALMKLLRHQNVVRCYDVFLEVQFVNIVVDLFPGGDLIDGLNNHRKTRGRIPNDQLANLARQAVAATVHVHSLCIVHRDIKGENFLSNVPDIGDPACIVALADFGTACRLEPGTTLSEKVGTPNFWAPEVFACKYDFLCDVWALGVTIFLLSSGTPPFEGEAAICAPVGEGQLPFVPPSHMTDLCIAFLAKCMTKDPSQRPNAPELQRLDWLTQTGPPEEPPPPQDPSVARAVGGVALGICSCFAGVCIDMLASSGDKKPKKEEPIVAAVDDPALMGSGVKPQLPYMR
jgi:serine/threonine protein kinase